MTKSLFLLFVSIILLFYGCASKQASVPLSERIARQPEQQAPVGAGVKGKEGAIGEEELMRAEREKQQKAAVDAASARLQDIYFDFDSYAIRPDDIPVLKKMADWLATYQAVKLVIEGHCDERGTTEYNLALGQKRAEAAKDFLVKSGVSAKSLGTVSYGKETPVDAGHTEDAWAKNRRDHFAAQQ
jgi:peptidoglycan-associated lipoprotein